TLTTIRSGCWPTAPLGGGGPILNPSIYKPWKKMKVAGAQSRVNNIMRPPAVRKGSHCTRPDRCIVSADHACPLLSLSHALAIAFTTTQHEPNKKRQLDQNPIQRCFE
ncbi:unnamed protein product, partial [Ectocarpus sp. 6 AP-2014]